MKGTVGRTRGGRPAYTSPLEACCSHQNPPTACRIDAGRNQDRNFVECLVSELRDVEAGRIASRDQHRDSDLQRHVGRRTAPIIELGRVVVQVGDRTPERMFDLLECAPETSGSLTSEEEGCDNVGSKS